MSSRAAPPGFVREDAAGAVSVVREDRLPGARALGLLARDGIARAFALGVPLGGGRATAARLRWPDGPDVVVRQLRHRGVLGPLLGRAYLGPGRVLRELSVTAALTAAAGHEPLVPRAVLALARQLRGPLWELAIGTEHVAGDDLFAALARAREAQDAAADRALGAAARAVRRLHDLGGRHADLNASNVLVRGLGGELAASVIDLDRARLAAPLPPRRRAREIARLWRSLAKRGRATRLDAAGRAAFVHAYCAGDEALATALQKALRRERVRSALHAWRYPRS